MSLRQSPASEGAASARAAGRSSTWRAAGLLAALVGGLVVALPSDAVQASAAVPAGKLDPALAEYLRAAPDDRYVDSLVVFEEGASRAALDALDRPVRHFQQAPVSRVLLDAGELAELVRDPQVRFVEPNHDLQLMNAEARELTRVTKVQRPHPVHGAPQEWTGAGVDVAVLDTGTDATHPDLRDAVVTSWVIASTNPELIGNYTNLAGKALYVSSDPRGISVDTPFEDLRAGTGVHVNTDSEGHGTHVAGIIGAQGDRDRGVAPGARLHSYALGMSPGVVIPVSHLVEAYEHVIARKRSGEADVDVVNLSFGLPNVCAQDGTSWADRPGAVMMFAAFQAEILTVHSYGNSGDGAGGACTSTRTGVHPFVLSVGMTDKGATLTPASSRGKAGGSWSRSTAYANYLAYRARPAGTAWDPRSNPLALERPGLVAPGEAISSTQSAQHPPQLLSRTSNSAMAYGFRTGTSMASPHVAGIAALCVQAYEATHPGRRLSAGSLITVLEQTAREGLLFDLTPREAGAGLVDAAAAVEACEGEVPEGIVDVPLTGSAEAAKIVDTQTSGGVVLPGSALSLPGGYRIPVEVPAGTRKLHVAIRAVGAGPVTTEPMRDAGGAHISLFAPGITPDREGLDVPRPVSSTRTQTLASRPRRDAGAYDPDRGTWTVLVDGFQGSTVEVTWTVLR